MRSIACAFTVLLLAAWIYFLFVMPFDEDLPGKPVAASARGEPLKSPEDAVNAEKEQISKEDRQARVAAALEKFKTEQAKIPVGALAAELHDLEQKTTELGKMESPKPQVLLEVDENGNSWRRLEYPSGEIRYELAE